MSHQIFMSLYRPVISQETSSYEQNRHFAILSREQFYQPLVKNKISQLVVDQTLKTQGLTEDGKWVTVEADWPSVPSAELFTKHLSNSYVVLSQYNNGEYRLRSCFRCLGGGNTQSHKAISPQVQWSPPKPEYSKKNLEEALAQKDFGWALRIINLITPSTSIHYFDIAALFKYDWAEGVAKMIEKSCFKPTAQLLYYAIIDNAHKSAIWLIKNGAPIHEKYDGKSFLKEAIYGALHCDRERDREKYGDSFKTFGAMARIASALVEAGATGVDENGTSNEVLHGATKLQWIDILTLMFKNGAVITNGLTTALWTDGARDNIKLLSLLLQNGATLKEPNIGNIFPNLTLPVKQFLRSHLKDDDREFWDYLKNLSQRMIRKLQGDLFARLEAAKKLDDLEDSVLKSLFPSLTVFELFLPNSEADNANQRQILIDVVSSKLTELMNSSFYFDPWKNILRTTELEEELKDIIRALDEGKHLQIQDKMKREKFMQDQVNLSQQQLEQQQTIGQAALDQERQIANEQARSLKQYNQARTQDARNIADAIQSLKY